MLIVRTVYTHFTLISITWYVNVFLHTLHLLTCEYNWYYRNHRTWWHQLCNWQLRFQMYMYNYGLPLSSKVTTRLWNNSWLHGLLKKMLQILLFCFGWRFVLMFSALRGVATMPETKMASSVNCSNQMGQHWPKIEYGKTNMAVHLWKQIMLSINMLKLFVLFSIRPFRFITEEP